MRSVSIALVVLLLTTGAQAQVGTAFTYQGRLSEGAGPANGTYDFEFQLFSAAVGGVASSTLPKGDVTVANGLFTVTLDFGAAFSGAASFLEIRVRPGADVGPYAVLSPRQELTPVPNAVFAASSATVAPGGVGALQLAPGAVTSGAIASGQVVKSLNGLADSVTIAGSGGITVSSGGGTVTVGAPPSLPSGAMVVGVAGDTTLIGAGFTEMTVGGQEFWTPTSMAGAPSARSYHAAVWTGARLIVWGGLLVGGGLTNTGGQYDPVADSWTSTATTVGVPAARSEFSAVWTGTKMIIWGGSIGSYAVANTGAQYDPVGNSWAPTSTAPGVAEGREAHTAVWTGDRMIVWGGLRFVGFSYVALDSGAQYDPVLDAWTATSATPGVPSPRYNHTAVWAGTSMIVWGGSDSTFANTGGRYDPALDSWTPLSLTNAPLGRSFHTAVWTGTSMIVWGGLNGSTPLATGGRYDPASDVWTPMAPSFNSPTARLKHSAIWTGRRMIVWGGTPSESTGSGFNTGAQYDPLSNSWYTMNIAGAASGRFGHSAVWTGSRMIIWGGSNTNDGGQWVAFSYFRKN